MTNTLSFLVREKDQNRRDARAVVVTHKSTIPSDIVEHALQLLGNDFKPRDKVHFEAWDEKARQLTYIRGKETKTIAIAKDFNAEIIVEPISVTPVESSLGEQFTNNLKTYANESPIMVFLGLFGIVAAIIAFIQAVRGIESAPTVAKDRLDLLLDCPTAAKPLAFLSILSTTQSIVDKECGETEAGVASVRMIGGAVKNGEELYRCAIGEIDSDAVFENEYWEQLKISERGFAQRLQKQIPKATENDPVILPAGYFLQEEYHPVLLQFFKRDEKIIVRVSQFDVQSKEKIAIYEEFELETDQIEPFLKDLVQFQKHRGTSTLQKDAAGRRAFLKQATGSSTVRSDETLKTFNPIVEALVRRKAKTVASPEKMQVVTPSRDPWKLAQTLLGNKVDKERFMLQMIQRIARNLLKYKKGLDADKRETYLHSLDRRLSHFEKRLAKHYGEAFAMSVTAGVRQEIETHLKAQEVASYARQKKQTVKALSHSSKLDVAVSYKRPPVHVKGDKEASFESGLGIGAALASLERLQGNLAKKQLSQEEFGAVLDDFEIGLQIAAQENLDRHSRKSAQASGALLSALPPVFGNYKAYILKNADQVQPEEVIACFDPLHEWLANINNINDVDRLQGQIASAVRLFTDAQLRSGNPLLPKDWINLENARFLIMELSRHKMMLIYQKMHATYAPLEGPAKEGMFPTIQIKKKADEDDDDAAEIAVDVPPPTSFFAFMNAFHAKTPKEQGTIACTLGLTRAECLSLAMNRFYLPEEATRRMRAIPHLDIERDSPSARKFNALCDADPGEQQKGIVQFKPGSNYINRNNVYRQTLQFGQFQTPPKEADQSRNLYSITSQLLEGFLAVPVQFEDCAQQIEAAEPSFLSSDALHLRQCDLFINAAVKPEVTVFLGFEGSGKKAQLAMVSWLLAKKGQVEEELGPDAPQELQAQRITELQMLDVEKRINAMTRPLKVVVVISPLDQKPCIMIKGAGDSNDDRLGVFYYQNGLPGLPMPTMREMPFAHVTGVSLGDTARTIVGGNGFGPQGQKNEYVSHTPARLYLQAQEDTDPEFDIADRFSLRTLQQESGRASCIVLLDTLCECPHLLDHPKGRARIEGVLFHRQTMPEFFDPMYDLSVLEKKIPILQKRIEEAVKAGNFKRAGFLTYICQTFLNQMKQNEQNFALALENKRIATINNRDIFPEGLPLDTPIVSLIELLQKRLQEIEDGQSKANSGATSAAFHEMSDYVETVANLKRLKELMPSLGSHIQGKMILEHLRSHPESQRMASAYALYQLTPQSIEAMGPEQLVQILLDWEQLLAPGAPDISPYMVALLQNQIEIHVLPRLRERLQTPAIRDQVLNSWTHSLEQTTWQEVADHPLVFIGSQGKRIDVGIADAGRSAPYPGKIALPHEIVKHPIYEKLFGSTRREVQFILSGTRQICAWTEPGRKYSLVFDPSKQNEEDQLTVSFEEEMHRYVYHSVKAARKSNFSGIVSRQGMWIEEGRPQRAIVVLKKMPEYSEKPLSQDPNVVILELKENAVVSAKTGDHRFVCDDTTGEMCACFPFVSDQSALFLTDKEGGPIVEVRLLSASFSLVRSSKDENWRTSDSNWDCQVESSPALAKEFGRDYQQVLLVTNKGSQREIRIFPKLLGSSPVRALGETQLEFVEDLSAKPLSFQVDARGRMSGSHAAFLYMAYLAQAQGEYRKAIDWLECAQKFGTLNEADLPFIKGLLSKIALLPSTSTRTRASLLKLELGLRKILREKYRQPELEMESMVQFQEDWDRLAMSYQAYEKALKDPATTQALAAENLRLTKEEEAYFDSLRLSSIRQLLNIMPIVPLIPPRDPSMQLTLDSKPSENFMQHLVVEMQPADPSKTLQQLRHEGLLPNVEMVLGNFWTLWNLIRDKKISYDDLSSLLGPIDPSGDHDLDLAIAEGRRLLLVLAHSLNAPNPPEVAEAPTRAQILARDAISTTPIELRGRSQLGKAVQGYFLQKSLVRYETVAETCGTVVGALYEHTGVYTLGSDSRTPDDGVLKLTIDELEQRFQGLQESPERTLYLEAIQQLKQQESAGVPHPFGTLLYKLLLVGAPVTMFRYEALLEKELEDLEKADLRVQVAVAPKEPFSRPQELPQTAVLELDTCTGATAAEPSETDLATLHGHRKGFAQFATAYEAVNKGLKFPEPPHVKTDKQAFAWLLFAATQLKAANKIMPLDVTNDPTDWFKQIRADYLALQKEKQLEQLNQQEATAIAAYPVVADPMEAEQNRRIREGIVQAATKRRDEITLGSPVLRELMLDPLFTRISHSVQNLRLQIVIKRQSVLQIAEAQSANLQLGIIPMQKSGVDQERILQHLFDLYQDGEIIGLLGKDVGEELEKAITELLFLTTTCQQFEQVLQDPVQPSLTQLKELRLYRTNLLRDLSTLQKKQAQLVAKHKDTRGIDAQIHIKTSELENIATEWRVLSREILTKLDRTLAERSYANEDLNKARAFLVLEARAGIILTPEQIDRIKQIENTPNALEELRMGLGKSSVIFPMLARFLSRNGVFPIVLFTEELLQQSQNDMDRRAVVFEFDRNHHLDPMLLAQEYRTLLQVRSSGRYIITSVERIAALENKIIELHLDLKAKYQEYLACMETIQKIKEDPLQEKEHKNLLIKAAKLMHEMGQIQKKLFWLQKTSQLFDHEKTRIIADEADEIYNISSEKNYSEGSLRNIDRRIFDAGRKIFTVLADKHHPFFELFLKDQQSTLTPAELQANLLAVATTLADDQDYWVGQCGWNLELWEKVDKEQLAEYLVGTRAKRPDALPAWPQSEAEQQPFIKLAAMRHWLKKTFPVLANKRLGIDFDISTANGFSVTPRKEGREKVNTRFGEEYELAGYSLITYLRKPMTKAAFRSIYSQLEMAKNSTDPELAWVGAVFQNLEQAGHVTPRTQAMAFYAWLQRPDNRLGRLQLLRFVFLDTTRDQMFDKQIRRNVQDTTRRRRVAGASGTMNPFALPRSFKGGESTKRRDTTGDLIMRLSAMGQQGLASPVVEFEDPLEAMKGLCRDFGCKAIINQGVSTNELSTYQIIAELRKGSNRQFIFIDPITKTPMIWNHDEDHPRRFDKVRDASRVSSGRCLYYFSPADTRGTDFKIPQGTAALFTGPTTDLAEYEQAAWRCRKLGQGHSLRHFAEKAFVDKLRVGQDPVTVGTMLSAIKRQTIRREALANIKAASAEAGARFRSHMQGVLSTPIRPSKDPVEFLQQVAMTVQFFTAVEDQFVQSKSPTFASDYEDGGMEDMQKHIIRTYTKQSARLMAFSAFMKEQEKSVDKALLERYSKAVNAAKAENFAAQMQLKKQWKAEYAPNLPKSIEGDFSTDTEMQSQVQQQQQQQTQMQQQQQQQMAVSPGKLRGKGNPDETFLLAIANLTNEVDLGVPAMEQLFPNCGLKDLYISVTALEQLKTMPSQGDMHCYWFNIQTKKGQLRTVLLSLYDLDHTIKQMTGMRREFLRKGIAPMYSMATYRMANDGELPAPVDFSGQLPTDTENKSPKWLLQSAQTKLVLGIAHLHPDEQEQLHEWWKKLPPEEQGQLILQLEQRYANASAALLRKWNDGVVVLPALSSSPKPSMKPPAKSQDAAEGAGFVHIGSGSAPAALQEEMHKKAAEDDFVIAHIQPPTLEIPQSGNCAAQAVARQMHTMGHQVTHQQLRAEVANYMHEHADDLANNGIFAGYVEEAIKQAGADHAANTGAVDAILAKQGVPAEPTVEQLEVLHNDKRALILWYANYIKGNKVWLDKPFFEIMVKIYPIQIAILRDDGDNGQGIPYSLAEHWPLNEPITLNRCAVIYYRDTQKGRGKGNHFDQFDRTQQALLARLRDKVAIQGLADFSRHLLDLRVNVAYGNLLKEAQLIREFEDLRIADPVLHEALKNKIELQKAAQETPIQAARRILVDSQFDLRPEAIKAFAATE